MTRNQTLSLAIAAVLVALASGWMLGRGNRDAGPATAAAQAERKVLYYRNPMGLADTSPVPKKDAMGMAYIPVYEGGEAAAAPGTVVLPPDKVQALGVRTEQVRRAPLTGLVGTSGTVEVDETRQYVIAPRFEGWVQRLYANQTGMHVRAGEPLLAVYSPQLAAAQKEYRLADATARKLAHSDPASAAAMARLRDAARARLRNWGIGEAQLARLGRDGGSDNLVLTSPADAVVIDKQVVQGARFAPGDTILRLADLSTVWVLAKVPVAQAGGIAAGQPARFESVALPGRSFTGEVAFVQPIVDPATRTVDIRIALPNRAGDLRPGLYGTVLLEQPDSQPVLTVPRSAVLDTGTRQLVLVQTGAGRFASREVGLGRRAGDRIEVSKGLADGEAVVVSANFLIDAESNLQSALQGLEAHAGHAAPATGTQPSPAAQAVDAVPAPVPPPRVPQSRSGSPAQSQGASPRPAAADPHAGHAQMPAPATAPAPPAPPADVPHQSHEGH